ncbi:hypothetical protein GDO81_017952 [Engystomops pustulosus]|uniref:Hexosyltransferase n=1 Tax=Engystomops pustulosus TaxID=76066 RepID=A0AAV7A4B1_ENGPU|nr:hypothetical protein GDO81_017952 [Engystomops pustulosus]KAG8556182.1 hypothetical protein GDO81_017952 [Engystomops pustulosus]
MFLRKCLFCCPWTKLNTKRLVLHVIILGFVTIAFLFFMLLTVNNYSWVPWRPVNTYMLRSHDLSNLHYLKAVQTWQSEARQAIRETWGKEDLFPGVQTLRLFLLGTDATSTNSTKQALTEESQKYHDIILQDYMDTYNNLTIKSLMGFKWIATYCPQIPYVMKTDSDMFVNTEYLIKKLLLPDKPPRKNYFTGYLMTDFSPNRNTQSKWYMSPELYPGERYPVFCSGTGYVFSGDLAEKIFKVSARIKLLHLEDVFVGICLQKLGISPVPPPRNSDFNHWKVSYSHCLYNRIVTSHQFEPSELIRYWESVQQNKHLCG